MITLIFMLCMFAVFGKIAFFALKAAWGVTKLVLTLVFLPVTLVLMVAAGLIHLALPILIIVGIISLFSRTPAKA
ncbi:MAG: hypothetical protein K6F90_06145 [Lachnospiraceae bacterium]|nr:hypothetical protein [Lachnospiraceae bacterium]